VSKKWKIAIGVVVAAVVVAGIALTVWGVVTFRNRVYEHGWGPGEWRTEAATQLRRPELVEGEVRLVDDDGDGIPDRGVIEVPTGLPFGRGFGPGRGPSILRRGSGQAMLRTGSRFGPGYSPHFGRGFGPFLFVGGLFRLAFLALLIGLAVACFRRWSRAKRAREPQ
jgi:hypothetical protein